VGGVAKWFNGESKNGHLILPMVEHNYDDGDNSVSFLFTGYSTAYK
jgi:hypothetical protein